MSCIFDREEEKLHCSSSWQIKLSVSWGHRFGRSAMIEKSWVQYSISPCTVQLPVLPEELTPYCSQNNVPVVLFEVSFFFNLTWPFLYLLMQTVRYLYLYLLFDPASLCLCQHSCEHTPLCCQWKKDFFNKTYSSPLCVCSKSKYKGAMPLRCSSMYTPRELCGPSSS